MSICSPQSQGCPPHPPLHYEIATHLSSTVACHLCLPHWTLIHLSFPQDNRLSVSPLGCHKSASPMRWSICPSPYRPVIPSHTLDHPFLSICLPSLDIFLPICLPEWDQQWWLSEIWEPSGFCPDFYSGNNNSSNH